MHYGPEDNTYVYFRYDGARKVMVAINASAKETVLGTGRFHEMLDGVAGGTDVLTGRKIDLANGIRLPAQSVTIVDL